jgi:Basic region leucine zipper
MNINKLLGPPLAQAQRAPETLALQDNEDVHAQPSVIDPQLLPHFEQSCSKSQTMPNQHSSKYSSPYLSLEGNLIPVDVEGASREKDKRRKQNAESAARYRKRHKEGEKETAQHVSELKADVKRLSERISDLEWIIQHHHQPHICARPCCSDMFPSLEKDICLSPPKGYGPTSLH